MYNSLGTHAMHRLIKYNPAVYPHLNDFTGKLNVRYLNRPTQLRISKPSYKNIPVVPEFCLDKQTDGHPNRHYNFI